MKTNIFYDRKLWERWHELEGMEINTLNKPPQWESDIVCLPMNSRQDAQKSSVTKKKLCIVSGFPCQHHPWSQKQYLSFCLFFFFKYLHDCWGFLFVCLFLGVGELFSFWKVILKLSALEQLYINLFWRVYLPVLPLHPRAFTIAAPAKNI